jgi:ribosomal protein S18 acetylase RimI-like enzyme
VDREYRFLPTPQTSASTICETLSTGERVSLLHSEFLLISEKYYLALCDSVYEPLTIENLLSRITAAMIQVRTFLPSDARQVEHCFAELQSFERSFEENRVDGEAISSAYLKHMLDECSKWDGCILVAEHDGRVVGFVCVLARFDSQDMIEAHTECAYVTDIVVTSKMRGHGIGLRLLQEAETFSRQRGASVLRLNVLAENRTARVFYSKNGFRELEIKLIKPL